MNEKILQIIPAPRGSYAIFKRDNGTKYTAPLVCWALCADEEGNTRVVGLDLVAGEIEQSPDYSGFVGYGGPGLISYEYKDNEKPVYMELHDEDGKPFQLAYSDYQGHGECQVFTKGGKVTVQETFKEIKLKCDEADQVSTQSHGTVSLLDPTARYDQ